MASAFFTAAEHGGVSVGFAVVLYIVLHFGDTAFLRPWGHHSDHMLVGISETLGCLCAGKAPGDILTVDLHKFVLDEPTQDTKHFTVMKPVRIQAVVLSAGAYTTFRNFAHPAIVAGETKF